MPITLYNMYNDKQTDPSHLPDYSHGSLSIRFDDICASDATGGGYRFCSRNCSPDNPYTDGPTHLFTANGSSN